MSQKDVQRHGWHTIGCPGCEAVNRNSAVPKNHNEACRARIETAIAAYDVERYERALGRYATGRFEEAKDEPNKKRKAGGVEGDRAASPGRSSHDPFGSRRARRSERAALPRIEAKGEHGGGGQIVPKYGPHSF